MFVSDEHKTSLMPCFGNGHAHSWKPVATRCRPGMSVLAGSRGLLEALTREVVRSQSMLAEMGFENLRRHGEPWGARTDL